LKGGEGSFRKNQNRRERPSPIGTPPIVRQSFEKMKILLRKGGVEGRS